MGSSQHASAADKIHLQDTLTGRKSGCVSAIQVGGVPKYLLKFADEMLLLRNHLRSLVAHLPEWRMRDYSNEHLLFHGTTQRCSIGTGPDTMTPCVDSGCALCSIIRYSYDVRKCGQFPAVFAFSQLTFQHNKGRDLYLCLEREYTRRDVLPVSPCPAYLIWAHSHHQTQAEAASFISNQHGSPNRVLLVNRVLVGTALTLSRSAPHLTGPPTNYHSVRRIHPLLARFYIVILGPWNSWRRFAPRGTCGLQKRCYQTCISHRVQQLRQVLSWANVTTLCCTRCRYICTWNFLSGCSVQRLRWIVHASIGRHRFTSRSRTSSVISTSFYSQCMLFQLRVGLRMHVRLIICLPKYVHSLNTSPLQPR